MQQLPNSVPENITPESLHADMSEQHPRFLGSRYDRTQVLSGWKEIANYMHQGVRTVQRWELIGLPIRRVRDNGRSPVIAFAEELYKVLCNRPSEEENRHRWQSTTH
jgi:hypothetical protein